MQAVAAHRSLSDMTPHLLTSFVYMHNLVFGGFPGAVNGVAWSLEVEVQFYVLVPLLTVLFTIRNARIRRTLTLVIMLIAGLLSNPLYGSLHFHYSIAYYLAFFLAGFMVCDFYLTRQNWQKSYVWDAIALALWPLVWYLGKYTGHVVLPFVIVVLYLTAFRGKICSAVFSNPVITNIGGMCYRHLPVPLHHHLRREALNGVTAYWRKFLGLLPAAVSSHPPRAASTERRILCLNRKTVHGSNLAAEAVE